MGICAQFMLGKVNRCFRLAVGCVWLVTGVIIWKMVDDGWRILLQVMIIKVRDCLSFLVLG